MMTTTAGSGAAALVPTSTGPGADLAALQGYAEAAADYAAASRAESTRAAYAGDWRLFERWAIGQGLRVEVPTDPRAVLLYLAAEGERLTAATLARRLAAIRWHHHQAGAASPTDHPQVRAVLAGIRRTRQDRTRQAQPLYLADVRAAVAALPDGPKGTRDRALLLVGWWAALRRSELVGLDVEDVADHPAGATVELRRSKTDQAGAGRLVPLHYRQAVDVCPVRAVRAWVAVADVDGGALFRRVDRWGHVRGERLRAPSVAAIVRDAAAACGLDPAGYSGHSLRAGFVSEADRRGIPSSAVRVVTGHASDVMLAVYQRPRALFESSAGAYFEGE